MSTERIRNRIKLSLFQNISEIALKVVRYKWSTEHGGIDVIIYNTPSHSRDRRKSISIVNLSFDGISRSYVYGWLQQDYGIDAIGNHIIIDGVDFV